MENQKLLNQAIKKFKEKYNIFPLFKTSELAHGIKIEIYVKDLEFPISVSYRKYDSGLQNLTYIMGMLEALKNFDLELLN